MSTYDYRDPGCDPEYCNGLSPFRGVRRTAAQLERRQLESRARHNTLTEQDAARLEKIRAQEIR